MNDVNGQRAAINALLAAQEQMLNHYSETPPGSIERLELWINLHRAADVLRDALDHRGTVVNP